MFKVANPPHPFLGFAKVKGLRISELISCHHMVGHSGWVGHGCPKNYSECCRNPNTKQQNKSKTASNFRNPQPLLSLATLAKDGNL